ncbi:MAG TPA: carbohydrate ABC transporter permease [Chloroflexota bacterium]|nr:carbohydrate ABC transporter permease [Chloroflexota bacterium]
MAGQEALSVELTGAHARRRSRLAGVSAESVVFYLVIAVLSVIFLFPFFWTVMSSLKQPFELFEFPPSVFPSVPQWVNYLTVLRTVPFLLWVWNSLIVVTLSTIGVVVSSSIVAYSFARFEYRGRDLFFMLTLATMMLPAQVTLIPQFILFNALGWINTLLPLWVPFLFGGGAFYIFLLRQFLMSLPADLDEAALIDGASYFQVFWSVLLPLCQPALAAVAIITFVSTWNDFLSPLIYLNSQEKFTLALGLQFFQNVPEEGGMPLQHLLMAASVMAIIPCLVLFFSFQRYFVEGVVLSGIKG